VKHLLLCLFVVICTLAFAQTDQPKVTSRTSTLGEDITAVLGQLKDAQKDLEALEQEGKPITGKRSDLLWTGEQLQKQEDSYDAQVKDYATRLAPYSAKAAYHDAHQCMNECINDLQHCDNRCAWYHQEMLDLQAQGQALKKEYDDLGKTKELLDAAKQNHKEEWAKWLEVAKPWAVKAVAAEKRYKELYERLQELKNRYGDCSKTGGSLETLKHKCGNIQFDGADKSLGDLNDSEIKPPFKAIPSN
jgi:chromosome segregation ATPase